MKHHTITYTADFERTPLSFWVHRHLDDPVWIHTRRFDPPLPAPLPGRGYPRLTVEFNGVTLDFASLAELDHLIDILSRNPLPSTRRLSEHRGTAAGPNRHWLSRLPARAKAFKFRKRLVAWLNQVRATFATVCSA